MGQYYKPVILANNKKTPAKWMYSHDFGSGLKLMEHSWQGNDFVGTFEALLINNPQRVVWAGDYAEPEKGRKNNVYMRCVDKNQITPTGKTKTQHRYIVNHSQKTFVDKWKTPKSPDVWGWKIHPLPLLTCEGNGQGGGDFRGESPLVGSWARDIISVESSKYAIPEGFTETIFNLIE